MKKIRSKHNSLLNYFIHDERDLSPAYVASCRKFLDEFIEKRIRENMGLKPGEVDDGSSGKPQAASAKPWQDLKYGIVWDYEIK